MAKKPRHQPFDEKVAAGYAAKFEHLLKGAKLLNRTWATKPPRDYSDVADLSFVWGSLVDQWQETFAEMCAAISADLDHKTDSITLVARFGLFGPVHDALTHELIEVFASNPLPLKTRMHVQPGAKPNSALADYAPTVRQRLQEANRRLATEQKPREG